MLEKFISIIPKSRIIFDLDSEFYQIGEAIFDNILSNLDDYEMISIHSEWEADGFYYVIEIEKIDDEDDEEEETEGFRSISDILEENGIFQRDFI